MSDRVTEHFWWHEFDCHDGTPVPDEYRPNVLRLCTDLLEPLRVIAGQPLLIISGYRTPDWNQQIGGRNRSQHLQGMAADIAWRRAWPLPVLGRIESVFAVGQYVDGMMNDGRLPQGGLGYYPTFLHVDLRGRKARW